MDILKSHYFPQPSLIRLFGYICFCQKSYVTIEKLVNTIFKKISSNEPIYMQFFKKVIVLTAYLAISYRVANLILISRNVPSPISSFTIFLPIPFILEKLTNTSFTQNLLISNSLCSKLKKNPELSLLKRLSIEEKVGQLLMVHFNGKIANEDAKTLIQKIKVGGIIYYNWSNSLESPDQIKTLSKSLQDLAKENQNPIPLLIATDQENGVVSRLNNGFSKFPGNMELVRTYDLNQTKKMGEIMGKEMLQVGINMNLAPVVDVALNENNYIGSRSFSINPKIVAKYGKKVSKGFKSSGMISTLKHFPGLGHATSDPHKDLPIIKKSIAKLEEVELLPFRKIANSAEVIMTAHVLVPALDDENCSSLSEKTITFLRKNIGFNGIIITDSLVMEGVMKTCINIENASIRALKAGSDILLLGGKQLINGNLNRELSVDDIKKIHIALVTAIKNNEISEERLNEAVKKILFLKKKYKI